MLACSFVQVAGVPGPFLDWGVRVVREVLAQTGLRVVEAATEEGDGVCRLLISNGPDYGVLPPGGRCLVFLDTAGRALAGLAPAFADVRDALRAVTAALAPMPGLMRQAGTRLIRAEVGMSAEAVRRAVWSGLFGAEGAGELADATLGCEADMPTDVVPELKGTAAAIVRQMLTPMVEIAAGGTAQTVIWPHCCLFSGEVPGEPPPSFLDLEGPARALYFGPYYHMPEGAWRVEMELFISEDAKGERLAVDAAAGEPLARMDFEPPGGGVFRAILPVVVADATRQIEVRVWLERGTIAGHLSLRHVRWVA